MIEIDLHDALEYGRRMRRDPRGFDMSMNERRMVLVVTAVDEMARALRDAAAVARSGRIPSTRTWEQWRALSEAAK
jgi:hypothetical protein